MSTHSHQSASIFPLVALSWKAGAALAAVGVAAALWWAFPGPPVVDACDLAAGPEARRGREVVVTGEWVLTQPSAQGYLVVVVRGRDGGRVACHFESEPADKRLRLEARLLRAPAELAVRGRCDGVEDGMPVLRGCSLLD